MANAVDVNGLQLFYRDTGEGEPLLLLHGFTGCGDDWQHVFAKPIEGYRVIAPDLRGHGRSTNPGGTFLFKDVARDIFALLDAHRHRSREGDRHERRREHAAAHGHRNSRLASRP